MCIWIFWRPARRECRIVGESGYIHWDYVTNKMVLTDTEANRQYTYSDENFVRNDMFIYEVQEFIDAIRGKCTTSVPLQHGIDVMKISMAAIRSLQTGQVEVLGS